MACEGTELVAFADVYTKCLEDAKQIASGAMTCLDYCYILEDKSFFWDYSGGNYYENMCHQLASWYKVLDLKIPKAATSTGGVFLWKDGREVPDTMCTSMEHPEELLVN